MNTEGNWGGPSSSVEGERPDIEGKARETAEKARSQVLSLAETGREELAEQIGGLGRALRSSSETLRNEEQGQAGYYSELLADQAERVSRFLRDHDSSDLIGRVEGFARRQPALFLGGCVIAGLALGRFLKASPGESAPLPLGVTGGERGYESPSTGAIGTEPIGSSFGTEPLGTTPVGTGSMGTGPFGSEPLGVTPGPAVVTKEKETVSIVAPSEPIGTPVPGSHSERKES